MKHFSCLTVLLLALPLIVAGTEKTTRNPIFLFPQALGNVWVYQKVSESGKKTTIERRITMNYYDDLKKIHFIGMTDYKQRDGKRVTIEKTTYSFRGNELYTLSGKEQSTAPRIVLPDKIYHNKRWVQRRPHGSVYFKAYRTVSEKVLGQTYEMLHIRMYSEYKETFKQNDFLEDRYYARGVGLVKRVRRDLSGKPILTLKLKKARIKPDRYLEHYRTAAKLYDQEKYQAAYDAVQSAHKIRDMPRLTSIKILHALAKNAEANSVDRAVQYYNKAILELQDVHESGKEDWREVLEKAKWALLKQKRERHSREIKTHVETNLKKKSRESELLLTQRIEADERRLGGMVFWSVFTGLGALGGYGGGAALFVYGNRLNGERSTYHMGAGGALLAGIGLTVLDGFLIGHAMTINSRLEKNRERLEYIRKINISLVPGRCSVAVRWRF